jgi:hypothetical protein
MLIAAGLISSCIIGIMSDEWLIIEKQYHLDVCI